MHNKELEIIKQLMEQLQEEMEYGPDDFEERLGRKKPDVEIVKVKKSVDDPSVERAEEVLGEDLDDDMEMGEDEDHREMVLGDEDDMEESSPDKLLVKRLMKLREDGQA